MTKDENSTLIPCLREIRVGEAVDMAKEGRVAAFLHGLTTLAGIAVMLLDRGGQSGSTLYELLLFLQLFTGLVQIIYEIRLNLGLIEMFGRKKRWILLWITVSCIPAMLWGWMKKYQPEWTVQEVVNSAADYFSGSRAEVMDQGLTVNLEERTATEFFKKKYLLRDIHMYIQPGHMVLLLGGSGAGKTTYINAVNGYEKAKAEVVLNGRNMYRDYKDMKYDIGFVPQQDLMRGSDGVYRTLMDAAALRLPASFTKAQREARVEEVMDIFGLTPVKNNLVVKLSGGQRKRLSIAMEFLSNPSLFILDEPDSGLDGVMARELFEQLHAGPGHRPVRRRDRAGEGRETDRAAGLVRADRRGQEILRQGKDGGDRQVRQPRGRGRRRPGGRVYYEVCGGAACLRQIQSAKRPAGSGIRAARARCGSTWESSSASSSMRATGKCCRWRRSSPAWWPW